MKHPNRKVEMMNKDEVLDSVTIGENKIDLRDYFASQAIDKIVWNLNNKNECAKFVYEVADAMMKARKQS